MPGTIVGRLAGVPIVINQEHGWAFEGKPVRRFLDRHVVARGDAVLAVSQHDRRQIIEIEGMAPQLVRVLPNGIDPIPTTARDIRAELGASPGTALIGAVGRLVPEKGHADLIRAIALLCGESRDIRCVIAGEGPEEGPLNELIEELNIGQSVQLLGPRIDVYDVIRALDVAVLCSKHEGSPLALMEYMACGAPIVATSVGGIPEMIEHGVHGLLVEPNDPLALAGAIGRLLDDGGLADKLGTQARDRQRAEFDLGVVVTRLEQLYLELCRGTRARDRQDRSGSPSFTDHEDSNSDSVRATIDRQV